MYMLESNVWDFDQGFCFKYLSVDTIMKHEAMFDPIFFLPVFNVFLFIHKHVVLCLN